MILPFFNSIILSHIFKADGLWVIIIHVGLFFNFLIESKILISVSLSNAEVDSSKISIGAFLKNARAIHNLCA